jgi:hypothetical protein
MVQRLLVPPDVTFPFSLGTAVSRKTTLSRMVLRRNPTSPWKTPINFSLRFQMKEGFCNTFPMAIVYVSWLSRMA